MTPRQVILPLLALCLCACSVAPRYQRPQIPAPPEAYRESEGWKPAQPADAAPRGAWWKMFADPALDDLESRAHEANQDLKAAFARLEEARAGTRIARSGLLPSLGLGAKATRYRSSTDAPTYNKAAAPVASDFVLDADLSYEIDLWGRVRSTLAAARAGERASAADLASFELGLQAEVAVDYFMLRSEDAQQAILDRSVASYERATELTGNLFRGGAAPISDLQQAQAQLQGARTLAAEYQLRRAQGEHAIAVLLGESASTFRIDPRPLPIDLSPPPVDPGLPSTLIERRPDVAAAERRAAAANAGIGIARAAYFPVFGLASTAGFESASASNWISAPSRLWSAGPAAALSVFDAGLHRAQSAQARARFEEAVAAYRGTVLLAYQEVEDALAALRQLELESGSEAAAVTATRSALEQAQYRYQGGLVTYIEVVASENAALAAQLSALDIEARRMMTTVLLVKALGGGWSGR